MFEGLPVIHDPWFWAVAVPMVLMTGLAKSGFASGLGSMATPMLALAVPVPQAAAIMLPLLLVMDAAGLRQLWKLRDRALVRLLVPWGLLGIVGGALLFGSLPGPVLSGLVGVLTLAFVAQRVLFAPGANSPPVPRSVGRALASVSGFTSFVIHAGGPPIQAYVLPLRLQPLVAAASMAVYFASINAAKVVPYAVLGLIDLRNMLTAALLVPFAVLGVWLGVRLLHRVNTTWFYRLAYTGMCITGVKLVWDGLRGTRLLF